MIINLIYRILKMKKILFLLSGLALTLSLASCSMDMDNGGSHNYPSATIPGTIDEVVDYVYSIEVIEYDGTVLGNKYIHTTSKKSLFKDLATYFDLEYEDSEYGHYIKQINSSMVDPNYALMLYQNGKLSSTGVDDIILNDNDSIRLVNERWNKELDETDRLVDKVIYSFMEDADSFLSETYNDFYLLAAINKMMEMGYSKMNLDFLSDSYLEEIKNKDVNDIAPAQLLRHIMLLKASNTPLDKLRLHMENTTVNPVGGPYGVFSDVPYYLASRIAKANIKNIDAYKGLFKSELTSPSLGDAGALYMHVLGDLEEFDSEARSNYLNAQKAKFQKDGVAFDEWSSHSVSAGCQIRGFAALGENIRDEKYQVNGVDMVEAVLMYLVNDYEFKSSLDSEKPDNGFATPQILAGLMAYKMSRDYKLNNSFKAVDIFA